MIIQCEKCGRKIEGKESEIKAPGGGLKCPNCGHVFSSGQREISYGGENIVIDDELSDFKREIKGDTATDEADWEDLRIDRDLLEIPDSIPKFFEDEETDTEQVEMDSFNKADPEKDTDKSDRKTADSLSHGHEPSDARPIDTDLFSIDPLGTSGEPAQDSPGLDALKSEPGRGILGTVAYGIIAAAILMVIVAATYVILLNTGIIPERTSDEIRKLAQSVIPLELSEQGHSDVIITEHSARWINTRNGPLYIVSGMITNRGTYPVHFVKIHSEFMSAGQLLFENDVYAGNTFSDKELKVSHMKDILLKLKKKDGNREYYNTDKPAGLNYNIQPGESIPFYTVFLPQSKMLGLKYSLRIANYQDTMSN